LDVTNDDLKKRYSESSPLDGIYHKGD